jgi:hypothetical protein
MINSSPHREITLISLGRRNVERQLTYQFPVIEVKDRFEQMLHTDISSEIAVQVEIGVGAEELSQGEVGYGDREGGLLVIDEDDSVLDLHLFGFDEDPAARTISGTVRLIGAGRYIRTKLNQSDPEEVLSETRDGFSREHPFYRQLRDDLYPRLQPIVARLRELVPGIIDPRNGV